jgi:hypothetical protein
MDATLRSMLNETERALLRAAEPKQIKKLDEDELGELHNRIRRARNKYSKLYRRRAKEQVGSDRARGRASASHAKAARKAEGFEDALARVSTQLAKLAEAAAEELKAERLAAARRTPVRGSGSTSSKKTKGSPAQTSKKARTPASEKRRASTKSSNKRKQVARDRRS